MNALSVTDMKLTNNLRSLDIGLARRPLQRRVLKRAASLFLEGVSINDRKQGALWAFENALDKHDILIRYHVSWKRIRSVSVGRRASKISKFKLYKHPWTRPSKTFHMIWPCPIPPIPARDKRYPGRIVKKLRYPVYLLIQMINYLISIESRCSAPHS